MRRKVRLPDPSSAGRLLDAVCRSVQQLESAQARGDLNRVSELARSLDRRARSMGDESLALSFRRLRSAERLVPQDLTRLVDESVAEARRTVRWLRVCKVLSTPPGASPWDDAGQRQFA